MGRLFDIFMKIIFSASVALFLVLLIVVIILGPEKTEKAIKSLFHFENYFSSLNLSLPKWNSKIAEKGPPSDTDKVLGETLETRNSAEIPPLIVPTSGIAPSSLFLFSGPLSLGKHEGVDIWTNLNGTGMDGVTYSKGNPVYAACSGYVKKIWAVNGDLSIVCDELDSIYEGVVPSRVIKTLYGHMGDQKTKELYIYVSEGQRVEQGDLIGNQGNLCFYSPQNIVVHLHFGVYDIRANNQIPLDPTPYIGVSATTLDQVFVAGVQ